MKDGIKGLNPPNMQAKTQKNTAEPWELSPIRTSFFESPIKSGFLKHFMVLFGQY